MSDAQAESMSGMQLADVTASLSGKEVITAISAELRPSRLIALVGPNGAGKTTLLKAMAGLVPSGGTIVLDGQSIPAMARYERARRIAYLPQGHQVHWPLSARDVVALGRFPHGLTDPAKLESDHVRAVHEAMQRTDVLEFANRPVSSLSGGERARVMLARVLAVQAPVVLADEPTASLDPHHQMRVLQELQAESRRGTLVIVATHDIGLASRLADEMLLLNKGRLVAQGKPHHVLTDQRLAEVYGITVQRQTRDGETLMTPWGLS